MQYEDMPMRAYEITFTHNTLQVRYKPHENVQVYQARTMTEAVQAAEIDQLDNPCYLEPRETDTIQAAYSEHWGKTSCKPRFMVVSVRDLGVIHNVEVTA